MVAKTNKKGQTRYYVQHRNKSGKLKDKKFTEEFAVSGGLAISIGYDTLLDPDGIRDFQPLARMMAVVANHIRTRIRDTGMGHDGSKMGPAEISGGMWRSLTVSITGKGKARAYFKGSSASTRRTKTGWKVKTKRDGTPRNLRVSNKLKALTASGLGFTPPRDPETGRFMWWADQIRQQFASGKHAPVSILMPGVGEVRAAQSVLALGMQIYATQGVPDLSDWRGQGNRKLAAELRKALKI